MEENTCIWVLVRKYLTYANWLDFECNSFGFLYFPFRKTISKSISHAKTNRNPMNKRREQTSEQRSLDRDRQLLRRRAALPANRPDTAAPPAARICITNNAI